MEQRTSDTPKGFLLHPDRAREIDRAAYTGVDSREALVRAGFELAIGVLREAGEAGGAHEDFRDAMAAATGTLKIFLEEVGTP